MSNKAIAELVNEYSKAHQELIKIIGQKHARKTNTYHERRILQQVNVVLRNLIRESKVWTNSSIPRKYKKGVRKAIETFKSSGIPSISYTKHEDMHMWQIETLVRNTNSDLTAANMFVGRSIRDNVRQITLDTIKDARLTGRSVNQIRQELKNRYIDNKITSIKTKNGRNISLDVYASMVARSVLTETENIAVMEHVKASGHDLVRMSSHATTCPICAPLQGRVYSITGDTEGYPALDVAFSGVHANIHPNCKHFLIPYFPERDVDKDETKKFSNRSFNVDPRSQRQINNYNFDQERNRKRNADLRQWERYKIVMPSETPKSFKGFRKTKRANSKKYQQLQTLYRKIRRRGYK